MVNSSKTIKLHSIAIDEKNQSGSFNFSVDLFSVGNFNLFIGDNAQGKTRLFSTLKFLLSFFQGAFIPINTNFSCQLEFFVNDEKGKKESEVSYKLQIFKDEKGMYKFIEQVSKNGSDLFSSDKKLLIDEKEGKPIPVFFTPPNTPAVLSISGEKFETIELIKDFIRRICFIDSAWQRGLAPQIGATIVDPSGLNIAEVLSTWQKENEDAYDEVIYNFKNYFPFIDEVKVVEMPATPLPGVPIGAKAHMLVIKEKNISEEISQQFWSDGMLRALTLLAMPKSFYKFERSRPAPSLVCVDEIEDSLDFKSLKFIIDFYLECSEEVQIFISSHSPLVCGFIHPKDWRVVKRDGAFVRVFNPMEQEKDPSLEEQLKLFEHRYWEFYRKHISNSDLYKFKQKEK